MPNAFMLYTDDNGGYKAVWYYNSDITTGGSSYYWAANSSKASVLGLSPNSKFFKDGKTVLNNFGSALSNKRLYYMICK